MDYHTTWHFYVLLATSLFKFCRALAWWWSLQSKRVGTNAIKTWCSTEYIRILSYYWMCFCICCFILLVYSKFKTWQILLKIRIHHRECHVIAYGKQIVLPGCKNVWSDAWNTWNFIQVPERTNFIWMFCKRVFWSWKLVLNFVDTFIVWIRKVRSLCC